MPADGLFRFRRGIHSRQSPDCAASWRRAVTPIDSNEAPLEIALNLLRTRPCPCQAHLAAVVDLVKQTKCYRLDACRDFDRIPEVFRRILERETDMVHV